MTALPRIGPVRLAAARIGRIERLLARSASERSVRVLGETADALLSCRDADPVGTPVVELFELLHRRIAVQDLIVIEATRPVDLADRFGTLALGLAGGARHLTEVRTSVPRVRVDPRTARWLTAVAVEVVESFVADLPGVDVGVSVRVDLSGGAVCMSALGDAGPSAAPSLHLDHVRSVALAMGGRVRESLGSCKRSVQLCLPCRPAEEL